jgi:hypothetical protein
MYLVYDDMSTEVQSQRGRDRNTKPKENKQTASYFFFLLEPRASVSGITKSSSGPSLRAAVKQSLKRAGQKVPQHLTEQAGVSMLSEMGDEALERNPTRPLCLPVMSEGVSYASKILDHFPGGHIETAPNSKLEMRCIRSNAFQPCIENIRIEDVASSPVMTKDVFWLKITFILLLFGGSAGVRAADGAGRRHQGKVVQVGGVNGERRSGRVTDGNDAAVVGDVVGDMRRGSGQRAENIVRGGARGLRRVLRRRGLLVNAKSVIAVAQRVEPLMVWCGRSTENENRRKQLLTSRASSSVYQRMYSSMLTTS